MQVILVGGGGPTAIMSRFVDHLGKHGITILEHQMGMPAPRSAAEGLILINTIASHGMSDKARELADDMGVPFASVNHKWAHAVPVLKAKGFLPPDVKDDEEDDDMANGDDKDKPTDLPGQVKAIMGPQLGELRDGLATLKGQMEALESLLNDDRDHAVCKLEGDFKSVQDAVTKQQATLSAITARLDKLALERVQDTDQMAKDAEKILHKLEDLMRQAQPASVPPRPAPMPVSTKPVADAMLASLKAQFPHPITQVRWADAATATGVAADYLVEALTLLHEDQGLGQETLAVLHKCGWRLALLQPGEIPKAWVLADGSTLSPQVPVVAPPTPLPVPEPASAPAPEPARNLGGAKFQENSLSGRIFAWLSQGGEFTSVDVAKQFRIPSAQACKLLDSLARARNPRNGLRLCKSGNGPEVRWTTRPWAA